MLAPPGPCTRTRARAHFHPAPAKPRFEHLTTRTSSPRVKKQKDVRRHCGRIDPVTMDILSKATMPRHY
eukprot:2817832-Prymnesium_polylepis.1